MATKGENIVQKLLLSKFGLELQKIKEGETEEPDFKVICNDIEIAVCEVKDVEDVTPSESTGWSKDKNLVWSREDNLPEKVRNKIKKALKQLKKYNLPKILILVGFYGDANDLQQALTGYLTYSSENGKKINLYDKSKTSLNRIKSKLGDIDLYFWLDPYTHKLYFRHIEDGIGTKLIKNYFSLNMYKGTIIENSLENKDILDRVRIERHYESGDWILDDVLVEENLINELSQSLNDGPWYIHLWKPDEDNIRVIFKNKIFNIKHSDKSTWTEAVNYGKSIGISEEQLDFPIN